MCRQVEQIGSNVATNGVAETTAIRGLTTDVHSEGAYLVGPRTSEFPLVFFDPLKY